MFEIEKNVPIPKRGSDKKGELRLTIEKMEVGDSIVVPDFLRQVTYAAAKAAKVTEVAAHHHRDSSQRRTEIRTT